MTSLSLLSAMIIKLWSLLLMTRLCRVLSKTFSKSIIKCITISFLFILQAKVIILSASESIVDTVFPGLRLIYCQNPIAISITQIIGILITNQQSSCSMIGSVLPISLLPILCVDAIRTKTLQVIYCKISLLFFTN